MSIEFSTSEINMLSLQKKVKLEYASGRTNLNHNFLIQVLTLGLTQISFELFVFRPMIMKIEASIVKAS